MIATGLAILVVCPLVLLERICRALAGRDVFFAPHAEFIGLIPGKMGSFIRNAYYHFTLRSCPLNNRFVFGTMFTHSEAELGNEIYFGARCIIGMAKIGDGCLLADHVYVLSGSRQHGTPDVDIPFREQPQEFTQVEIGRNVWIGTNSVIMADIGDDCVIGAGSVVTKPIPAGSVAVGSPAKVIRARAAQPTSMSGAV